jgi:hypothetical protein
MNTDLPAAVCAAATTSNIQHPTPNIELTTLAPFYSAFDVRCSVFDVAVSLPTKQLLNVLNATGLKVGVLLNFGRYKVEVKRLLKYWSGPRCCRFWRWPRRERSADIRSDLGQSRRRGTARTKVNATRRARGAPVFQQSPSANDPPPRPNRRGDAPNALPPRQRPGAAG